MLYNKKELETFTMLKLEDKRDDAKNHKSDHEHAIKQLRSAIAYHLEAIRTEEENIKLVNEVINERKRGSLI